MKVLRPTGWAAGRLLLFHLTLRENRAKYKRSSLGWAWSMINPLATMLIFTFVFRIVLKIDPPVGNPSGLKNFSFFLICALLPWNFLSNSLTGATGSIVSNAGLIKKVYFPRSVLPASNVLSWDTNFLIELGVLSLALLIVQRVVFQFLPIALLVVVIQTLFVLGVGLAFASLNVYFRDVTHFLGILLLLWFYATPVIYPLSLVPDFHVIAGTRIPIKDIYNLNPMVHFTEAYRAIFYDLKVPSAQSFVFMTIGATVSLLVGYTLFKRLEPRFAEEL
ncbi:MAG: ABC transporter permease [Actinomycetota bacterium]